MDNRIRVAKSTVLRPQRQTNVLVTNQRVGFSSIEPQEELYQKNGIVAMNGVVEAQNYQAFHRMVAKYSKTPYRLSKNRKLGTFVTQEAGITAKNISVTEVFGLDGEDSPTESAEVTQ